jgi:hypothetical protein
MPRSRYIYTVVDVSGSPVLAAFTVKHELITWLGVQSHLSPADTVWRFNDGGHGGDCLMGTVEHVMAQAAT